jgi:hypothetical protein
LLANSEYCFKIDIEVEWFGLTSKLTKGDKMRNKLISSLSFEEIQERISDLGESIFELGGEGDSPEKRKELKALEELRESKPEWAAFLKEVAEARKTEDLPF